MWFKNLMSYRLTKPLDWDLNELQRQLSDCEFHPCLLYTSALNALCELGAESILYVSCNPATLVRDAEILRSFGNRIIKTAMIDMFPHTSHLESVTLFIK